MANSQLQSKLDAVAGSTPNRWGTPDAAIELLLTALGSGGGTARTPSITIANSNGSVATGAQSVSLLFSTDFAGTVLGATIDPTAVAGLSFQANGNDTIGAIAYTRSAGFITIAKIV